MNFASDYTYVRKKNNKKVVKKEEDDNDDNLYDNGYIQPRRPVSMMSRLSSLFGSSRAESENNSRSNSDDDEEEEEPDINVVALKFGTLGEASDVIFAGDPVECVKCSAIMSKHSHLTNIQEDGAVWKCEFCDTENHVDVIAEDEMPSDEVCDFVVEPAPPVVQNLENQQPVLFVVDVSGSMCVSTEVPGKLRLKVAQPKAIDLSEFGNDVELPPPSNTTWISRLQCVQAAINQQLENMEKNEPQRRVGLIAFSSDVMLYNDGTSAPVIVAGDKLNDADRLREIAEAHSLADFAPVSDSMHVLSTKLLSLQEKGQTALGPALVMALRMASRGSKIVIATDGLSNVGVGSLDVADDEREETQNFYESLGNVALSSGITVDVISIEGENCALEDLGKVAELSHGSVRRLNPVSLISDFSSILEKPIIATNVSAKVVMSHCLRSLDDDGDVSVLTREMGNVNEDSEIVFRYGVREDIELEEGYIMVFQVQMRYTKLDGMKCLRTITKSQLVTQEREKAEKDIKVNLLAQVGLRCGAELAEEGRYDEALASNRRWGNYISHKSQNSRVYRKSGAIFQQQAQEINNQAETFLVQDDFMQEMRATNELCSSLRAPTATMKKSRKRRARKYRGDGDYLAIQTTKSCNSSGLM